MRKYFINTKPYCVIECFLKMSDHKKFSWSTYQYQPLPQEILLHFLRVEQKTLFFGSLWKNFMTRKL